MATMKDKLLKQYYNERIKMPGMADFERLDGKGRKVLCGLGFDIFVLGEALKELKKAISK